MTFVGKVLVVLQVVLSLMFLGFAGAVFTVQTKWKDEATKQKQAAAAAQQNLQTIQADLTKQIEEKTAETKRQVDEANKFQAEAAGLTEKLTANEKQLAEVRTQLENAQALSKISGEEARARRDEVLSLRATIDSLHKTRNELIDQVRELSDKAFNYEVAMKAMNEKHKAVQEELALLQDIARKNDFNLDPKVYEKMQAPPPLVHGQVQDFKKATRNGSDDLVQVTLGSDDGLAKGHILFVYSSGERPKYLGKLKVQSLEPDSAVCVVIDKAKNGVIQKGDNVSSKL